MEKVRTIAQGLFDVVDDTEGRLYILSPNIGPKSVSILHEADPDRIDKVSLPALWDVFDTGVTAAADGKGKTCNLFPLITGLGEVGRMLAVCSPGGGEKPRIVEDRWDMYSRIRFAGSAGGPNDLLLLSAKLDSTGLWFVTFAGKDSAHVLISSIPRDLATDREAYDSGSVNPAPRYNATVVFSSRRYFSFRQGFWINKQPWLWVYDKAKNHWKRMRMTGSPRIFSEWEATVEMTYRPECGSYHCPDKNPGHDVERSYDQPQFIGALPGVWGEYQEGRGGDYIIPGILDLDNLADGRHITIHTGMEDSEILDVRDGQVLYRVNNKIFEATIEGDKLCPSTLVVEGDDVPEVHWAFWS